MSTKNLDQQQRMLKAKELLQNIERNMKFLVDSIVEGRKLKDAA